MYSIGENVVYPMYGAGTIEKIEEKEILGEMQKYYVLKLPYEDLKVMVPIGNVENTGLRNIISKAEMDEVIGMLGMKSTQMPSNWNHRHRMNMDKLKSGDVHQVAEVVRNLSRVEKEKKLSTGEKKILNNARKILISEMVLVKNISIEDAEKLIEDEINQ